MKKLIYLLCILAIAPISLAQEKYQKVKIYVSSPEEFKFLSDNGIPLTEFGKRSKEFVETILQESEVLKINNLGIETELLVENMQSFYEQRALNSKNTNNATCASPYSVPQNYHGGSMAGFLNHDEILTELDEMRQLYPNLISAKTQINNFTTENGNQIYYVRISNTPNVDSDKPEALYTALHHAREPQSSEQLIFYMWYLLENYGSDANIKNLVDHTEMYFIPILNPDGFKYNQLTNPNGFGMWRKNRKILTNAIGVDINRNYGFHWGGEGASNDPNSDTYRGESAFSETETQAIKWFTEQHEFVVALNAHTFSGLFLYPYGYEENLQTPDQFVFENLGDHFMKDNGYTSQLSSELYVTSGGSDDWMYGDTSTKPKIFAFTPELGSDFWPPQSEIMPNNQSTVYTNLTAARFAGTYVDFENMSDQFVESLDNVLNFKLTKIGTNGGNSATVTLVPISSNIASVGSPSNQNELELFTPIEGQMNYTLNSNIQPGDPIIFEVKVNNGLYEQSFMVTKYFGFANLLVNDPADNLDYWTANGSWNTTPTDFVSSPTSITDSPNGDYGNSQTRSITLKNSFNLSDAVDAYVSFYAKWEIESLYDYVQFEISTDNGNTWIPQCGNYTSRGTQYQDENEPVYSGNTIHWKKEEISLSEYLGNENVLVRFVLVSDSFTSEDGFYFDDFQVHTLTEQEMGTEEIQQNLVQIYPNPVKNTLNISSDSKLNSYKIYDLSGRLVKQGKFDLGNKSVEVSGLMKGNYIIEIKTKNEIIKTKFLKN